MEQLKKVGCYRQLCSADEVTFRSGKAEGVSAYLLDNGRIRLCVTKDRCMDLLSLKYRGENMSFLSKNGIVSAKYAMSPWITFCQSFPGGFLYTCGLDNISESDKYAMHGSLSLHPAENALAEVTEEGGVLTVTARGEVHDTALFGKNLVLRREISMRGGEDFFTLTDTLENRGYREEDYILLYHFNLGYPLVDAGTRVVADVADTRGVTPFAEADKKNCFIMTEPEDNLEEKVYYHAPRDKHASVRVENVKSNRFLTFDYDTERLPVLVQWKSMASGDYVLGIEPATSRFFGEKTYSKIAAGEKIVRSIRVTMGELNE